MVMSVAALPGEMRRFLRTAHAGDMRVRFANLEPSAQLMYRLGHQAIFAAIGIAGAAIAVVLEGRGELDRAAWAGGPRIAGAVLVINWGSRGCCAGRSSQP
jgi:hypothetical protein